MNVVESVTIAAPPEDVWRVYTDVEAWPEWTASVTSLRLLGGAAGLAIGVRARIKQPRFPHVVWTVTALEPGRSWVWVARSPGSTTTATHTLAPSPDGAGTVVTQEIDQRGVLGALVGRLTRRLTRRYLAMEGAGLRQRVQARVASS